MVVLAHSIILTRHIITIYICPMCFGGEEERDSHSYTGTIFTLSSPKSTERPQLEPEANIAKQLCGFTRSLGTAKVSKSVAAISFRSSIDANGVCAMTTGCSSAYFMKISG